MPDKDLTTHVSVSLTPLIKGQRSTLVLYLALMAAGCGAALGLFLWSWLQPGATNIIAIVRNVSPLVPSSLCVPQIGACVSKIAQYRAIEEMAAIYPQRALKILEQHLSK
jgi:hypothetical protein